MSDVLDNLLWTFTTAAGAMLGMLPVALYHVGDMGFEAALLTQTGFLVMVVVMIYHEVAIGE